MYPELLRIGGFTIYSYGLLLALGVGLAALLAAGRTRETLGIPENTILTFLLVIIFAGIIGGRVGFVIVEWPYYRNNPLEIFMLRRGGLAIQGTLAVGMLSGIYYLLYKRLPVLPVLDIFLLYLPLGMAIGRLGCFFNGCCYGKPTALPWGITFPLLERAVHPTQLYQSLANLGIFLALRFGFLKNYRNNPGRLTAWFFILYGFSRFTLDRLRGEMFPGPMNLFVTQRFALMLIIFGAGLLLFRKERKEYNGDPGS